MLEIEANPNVPGGTTTTTTTTAEVRHSPHYINAAEVVWNGRTGANVTFRCNCTSTAFAPHKHGGEKGIHMRLQIDTYEVVHVTKSEDTDATADQQSNTETSSLESPLNGAQLTQAIRKHPGSKDHSMNSDSPSTFDNVSHFKIIKIKISMNYDFIML